MKGARFYFDYGSKAAKRKGGDAPNALVIFFDQWHGGTAEQGRIYDAGAALTDEPNSPAVGTGVADQYLRECCKRRPEAECYRIHPNLRTWCSRVETEVPEGAAFR